MQFYGGTDEWDAAGDSDHSSNGVESDEGVFVGHVNPMRKSASTSFAENPKREQLKRVAPDGGGPYSRDEFVQFYGGTDEWDAAGDSYDSSNGVGSDEGGGTNEWDAAGSPASPAVSPSSAWRDRRSLKRANRRVSEF